LKSLSLPVSYGQPKVSAFNFNTFSVLAITTHQVPALQEDRQQIPHPTHHTADTTHHKPHSIHHTPHTTHHTPTTHTHHTHTHTKSMASKLYSINYPDKKVVRCYNVFPPQESPLSNHPAFNSQLLEFHSSIASLPQEFKGTRMASYGLAKEQYKKNRRHDEGMMKKVVEEQENVQAYEGLVGQGGDGVDGFRWKGVGEMENVGGKVEGMKDQVMEEVEKEEWLEEHGDDAEGAWE
jgi:hypothetical protein